ncbi:MAG: hypothetical protein SOZ59_06620 [Candidatus Limivivens sp.]|nr:hypothetical protein [Candidatus Limivivens sp.]
MLADVLQACTCINTYDAKETTMDELAKSLYDRETITGEEFMEILNR